MVDAKKQLRKVMKQMLSELSSDTVGEKSAIIISKVAQLPEWKRAKTIGVTYPIQKEVNTIPLIEQGWKEGKIVALPKIDPKTNKMDFYQIDDFSKLEKNRFGIFEPKEEEALKVEKRNIDFLVIPCLAFDEHCFRLGYGGGYYDRYLADYDGLTCGICFECQRIAQIPVGRYDIPLKMIITEENTYQSR